ncbi:MAG: archease [Candidatus Sungbacteria bacterium]|nr:archease [Candidatus Sungbacteria bacterium]
MRDGYDIVERSGETRVRAWGRNERELFQRALLGLSLVLRPDTGSKNEAKVSVLLRIQGEGLSDVLSRFLSAALFEADMRNAVFSALHIVHFSPEEIECELLGRTVEDFEETVGACILHEVTRTQNGWEAEFTALTL